MAKQFIHGSANHKPDWYKRYQEIQETRQPTRNEEKAHYSKLMAEFRNYVSWELASLTVAQFEEDYRKETGKFYALAPYSYLIKRVSDAIDYQRLMADDPLNEFFLADPGEEDEGVEFAANRMIGMGG